MRALIIIGMAAALGGCMLNAVTSGRVAVTEPSGGTQTHTSASSDRTTTGIVSHATLTPRDRGIIRDYFKTPRPALVNRERLARDAGPGTMLSSAIRGRVLPLELEIQLSRVTPGYERRIVGRDIVLYERSRRTIADIVYDALP